MPGSSPNLVLLLLLKLLLFKLKIISTKNCRNSFLPKEDFDNLYAQSEELSRMLYSLIGSLELGNKS
jgi:hypothetical protein